MAMPRTAVRSDEYGDLQRLVDALFPAPHSPAVAKLDVVARAEIYDLCADLREVVGLLPSGTYGRQRLCDQLNSILTAHGWGLVYGTVE